MPVLTALSQFEQYDLETEVCDTIGCQRTSATRIVAEVLVPELERRLREARATAFDTAIADLSRVERLANTPLDDMSIDDVAWYRAPAQKLIREHMSLRGGDRPAVVEWLRTVALRSGT